MSIRDTRYPAIGYTQVMPGLWRFVDKETGACIGPQYKTRSELLADLSRFATLFGAIE